MDSSRLSPFRTRTANVTASQACPLPTNTVPNAPVTGRDDIRRIYPELLHMMHVLMPFIEEASALSHQVRHASPCLLVINYS